MKAKTIVVEERERKVASSGGTVAVYIPKEIKEYFKPGESITIRAELKGKNLVIVIHKSIFNFEIEDIRNLAKGYKLIETEKKIIGDVQIFQAEKNNISLSYTENLLEEFSPGYVTVSFKWSDLDHDEYNDVFAHAKKFQKEFDVIVRPEGDLDTINILKDPKYYKLDRKKAINLLRKAGKKVGASVTVRFNGKKNTLKEIETLLNMFKKLNS